jgi:hypothetical protein
VIPARSVDYLVESYFGVNPVPQIPALLARSP